MIGNPLTKPLITRNQHTFLFYLLSWKNVYHFFTNFRFQYYLFDCYLNSYDHANKYFIQIIAHELWTMRSQLTSVSEIYTSQHKQCTVSCKCRQSPKKFLIGFLFIYLFIYCGPRDTDGFTYPLDYPQV